METQTFNKDGKVYKYTKLDDILRSGIPESLKEEVKEKFKKRVYYGRKESCYIGTLEGIEVNEQLSSIFYMVYSGDKMRYLPYGQSITLL